MLCRNVCFDEAWRTSRAGIAGAGAETRCGIGAASARAGDRDGGDVMGWCSGGVRGLVSLVVPENVESTSLTAVLPTYLCMPLKIWIECFW